MTRAKPTRLWCCLAALYVISTAGCDTTVTPNLGSERHFTLWGVLNAKTSIHAVRVFTIDDRLQLLPSEAIDATISSTDLETGEVRVWADSVVVLNDGDIRHVYWDSFPVFAGRSYRIEARTSEGLTSWAETTVPGPVELEVLEPNEQLVRNTEQTVHVIGDPPTIPRVDLAYQVVGTEVDGTNSSVAQMTLTYDGLAVKRLEGWDVVVDFALDYQAIWRTMELRGIPNDFVQLYDLEMRVHVGDDNWRSPVTYFDPEFLVEPGAFSNVEDGFGYVGSGYIESVTWRPPDYLLRRAGFDVK